MWVTDWLPSGNWSLSSSKPLWCCRRFPADFRRPGKHSHNYKSMGVPLLSVFLTFCFSLSTWPRRYPHLSAHGSPELPHFLPGTEQAVSPQSAAYRGMGPVRCTPILLGPTGADLTGSTELPGLQHGGFPARQEPECAEMGPVILPLPGQRLVRWWRSRGLWTPQNWSSWTPTKDLRLLC